MLMFCHIQILCSASSSFKVKLGIIIKLADTCQNEISFRDTTWEGTETTFNLCTLCKYYAEIIKIQKQFVKQFYQSLSYGQTEGKMSSQHFNNTKNSLCTIIYSIQSLFPSTALNSVALVRKRTIPTERPVLVGKVSANVCR
jgi:hypothetical protein